MNKKRVCEYIFLNLILIVTFLLTGCAGTVQENDIREATEVYLTLNGEEILLGEINAVTVPDLKDTEEFILDDKEYQGKRYSSLDEAKEELELDFWERKAGYEWSDIILYMKEDGGGILQLLHTVEEERAAQEQEETSVTMGFMRFVTGEAGRINMAMLTDTEKVSGLSEGTQTERFQIEESYYCDNLQTEVTFIKSIIKEQVAFEGKTEVSNESYYVFWIKDDIAYQLHFVGDRSAIILWIEDTRP